MDSEDAIVDIMERALARFRDDNKLAQLQELSKPTSRDAEMQGSAGIDQAIRRGHPRFSTIWLNNTESLITLYRGIVSQVGEKTTEVDQLMHIHAEEHFNSFGSINPRYLNTLGFGTFSAHDSGLKIPATIADQYFEPQGGLLKFPNEVFVEIFKFLHPTAGYGRGALALTSKRLAAISTRVPDVNRTPSLVATGTAVQTPDTHRHCPGCGYPRSTIPADWDPHFATIRKLWCARRERYGNIRRPMDDAPINVLGPYGFQPGSPHFHWLRDDKKVFDDSVARWMQGRPHAHFVSSIGCPNPECFTSNTLVWEPDKMPLCPFCAAQHTWEIRQKLFVKEEQGLDGLDDVRNARDALVKALVWRKEQFLEKYPAERGVFEAT